MNDRQNLVTPPPAPMTTFMWGSVTAVSPLRVQLDGDTVALPVTPDSLIDPATLTVTNRVRCELSNNRLTVHGRAGGLLVGTPWTPYAPSWTNLTVGNGTNDFAWTRSGNTYTVAGRFTFGSTTSVSNFFFPSLPVSGNPLDTGVVWAFDNSATSWVTGVLVPGSYFVFGAARAAPTAPFTWASGDLIQFSITGRI